MGGRARNNGVTIPFNSVSAADNEALTGGFDLEEIQEAVFSCDGDRCPGPDSYNFKFPKHFWELWKSDFKMVLDDFHANGVWPRGTNSSFIALVPKVDSPQGLNDFRPISLVGCMYKVVSKILASRLKLVLHKLIDEAQFTFVGGRSMLNNVVVANEVGHEAKRKKSPTLILKVDFEKVYDSVSWDFLVYMLRRMNFSEKRIRWIRGCLESSSVSVLVNGSSTDEFKMQKGLRQGDPLAPFLFIIVAEGLNGLVMRAILCNKLKPARVGIPSSVEVSCL